MNELIDIVIPLASAQSPTNNVELRIALRSIDKNITGLGNIWIVTDNPPEWITNVNIIKCADTHMHNKDANLIDKVLKACDTPNVSDKFIFWSDDQLAYLPVSINNIKPSYNARGLSHFSCRSNKWSIRMAHTLQVVKSAGGIDTINWDSHVPQPYDKNMFKAVMSSVNYQDQPGLCINTAYFGLTFEKPEVPQNSVKQTFESTFNGSISDKMFIGYNDRGLNTGLKEALLNKFNEPSKYEK